MGNAENSALPQMSHRAQIANPFRAMVFGAMADEMIAAGADVVKLSLGEPDFGAPPAVRDAMREQYDGRPLPYTAAMGLPESQAFRKKKTAYHHFDGGVFASDMRHDVASRATLIFLFFRGFPRFSGLLNVFLRCHSTPLWQDPAKSGKSEKHPDKTQCKCETDQRALRSCMAYAGTCNAAIININEPTLFMQFTKDGS